MKEALYQLLGVGHGNNLAYFEAEQEVGPPKRYILKAQKGTS
ncbi:hypothetical protein [Cohnella sp. GbtcB17]|nr:hypothetical protein [Cohnella sp. GbtcB17]